MKNYQNKTKIIKVSKIFRIIFLVGMILCILGLLLDFAATYIVSTKSTNPPGEIYRHIIFFPEDLLSFMVALNLFRFFTRLKDEHLFDAPTVKSLEAAGKWWLAGGIFHIIFHSIEALMFHTCAIPLTGGGIFSGLIIIFMAWLFREAQELQEEQELTV
jgi:hypothetical protein